MMDQDRAEFECCVGDLLFQRDVQSMEDIKQHVDGVSCLDHCIFVSYLSFLLCKKWGLDYRAAARAGLLHDMYLCDWSTTTIGRWQRLRVHPEMALKNASVYPLSELEKDIILKHMWPVTFFHLPRHRESAVVNLADKLCAMAEWLRVYRLLPVEAILPIFNKRRPAVALFR
ncbi:MAG: HD family phosphohydrolase [Oscillospiraceae bacterium]